MRFEGQRRHFIPSPVGTKRFYGSSVRPPVTPLSRSDIPSVRPSDTICHVFVYIDNSRYHSLSNSKTTNSEMRDGRMSPQWQFPTSTRAAPLFQREIFEKKNEGHIFSINQSRSIWTAHIAYIRSRVWKDLFPRRIFDYSRGPARWRRLDIGHRVKGKIDWHPLRRWKGV